MATHPINAAFPHNASVSADTIRQTIGNAFPLVLESAAEIQSINFTTTNAVAVPIEVRLNGVAFIYDAADTTTGHDGTSCLVSQDNKRYKSSVQASHFTSVDTRTNAPPGSPAVGDRVLIGAAGSDDFASHSNKFAIYLSTGWEKVVPRIGQRTYVEDEETDYQYGVSGLWTAAGLVLASAIGAQELAFPWGMVVESEIATPPGTRATGATPTMPLGGTAANINDDTTATEGVTSALGNLSAASADGRVIAKLDLLSDIALAGIQVKGIKASTGSSSSNAMGLYYATAAAPATWVQLSTGFTLTTADLDVARSGTFTARYIAVITEAKDWSTATHTLDDLNAYKAATSISDGVKYLVAANAIAAFSGQDTKIAEAWNGAYRFYDPYDAALVLNRATKASVRFDDTTGLWVSAGGVWIAKTGPYLTTSGSTSTGGSGAYAWNDTTAPTTSLAHRKDDVSITHRAKAAGKVLRFTYQFNGVGIFTPTIALFRDSEVNALDWQAVIYSTTNICQQITLWVTSDDALDHTYHVRLVSTDGVPTAPTRRRFLAEEAA